MKIPARNQPPPLRTRRGPVRRLLETRGLVGGHAAPHVQVRLRAEDGVRLAGTYVPGPSSDAPAVVLLHGFAAHRRKPAYAYLADALSVHAHVLSVDLRGHGDSDGWSHLGGREALDARAAVQWLRAYGHPWVALAGMSMGGTAALHAASNGAEADAVVAISAPGWLREEPETEPMRRLQTVWRSPWLRAGMRALVGVRVVAPERWEAPPHPVEAARRVGAPLLVVHGADDAYFPMSDAEAIWQAAGQQATLWREPAGFGHAEDGVSSEFVRALGRAIIGARRTGRFPDRDQARAVEQEGLAPGLRRNHRQGNES